MERRKRKNKFPVSLICRRGFICLSLICALIIQPYTILADDSFAQADSADTAAQNNTADSAHSADVAAQDKAADSAAQDNAADSVHDAAQDNAADSAEASANIEDNRKEEAGDSDGVPADSMKSIEDGEDRDNVPEAGSSDVNADAISNVDANVEANVEANAKAEADANAKANSDANTEAEADANTEGDTDANTEVDTTANDDADAEITKASTPVLQSAGDSPAAESEFPSKFDLRDLGRVTPVKQQNPWGTCWAFAATAAAETSILSAMGKTYAETGLDLSERHLAWYVAQQVSENISASQAGEGLHLYDENPNNILLYGGKEKCAGTLYAQGIGPVPESEYPYRGSEGKLAYETLLAEKDAYINARIEEYRQAYYFLTEDELRSIAEEDYEAALSKYADYDVYSEFDDWTISEADEPGSGRLRGASYTLTDNNVFVYWVNGTDEGIDKFGKKPIAEVTIFGEENILYQDSIDQIKAELTAGHGVSVDIKVNENTFNRETWAHYYDGYMGTTPHGVCIVGWDDDYPASNFNKTPPGNGAWIVKNSWGSQTDLIPDGLVAPDGTTKDANAGDWGIVDENGLHTGYFYLSYYDLGIGIPESFAFELKENHDQENALQLDYMPASADEWQHKSEKPVSCANVFTLEKDMRIDEVATRFSMDDEVPVTGFTVTFDIYRLRDGAVAPDDGELLATCTRDFKYFGYHRVALDAPVYTRAGDRLAIVVRQRHTYGDGSTKYVVSAQESLRYRSNPLTRRDPLYGTPVINEGESFLKIEGVTEKEEASTGGWLDVCAPFTRELLYYMIPTLNSNPDMAEYYESITVGKPFKNAYTIDNFGIKAFGEKVTLEFVKAVEATCEKAGSLEHWRDPLNDAIFADEYGTKPLTLEDITVSPLGHAWGEPTYTWSGDNSSVTARSICQRENDHVLEETVDTTMTSSASCDKAGKTTWTALFENGIFTKQTRSVDTEPTCDETEEETVDRQSKSDDSGIRTNTVKTASAATARKTSDRKTSGSAATHQTSVHTADDSDLAHWFMLFAGALACMAALFVLHFNRRRV